MKNSIADCIKFYLFDAFLNFSGTHPPKFSEISPILNYDHYWQSRKTITLNKPLRRREQIVFDLIPESSEVVDYGCGISPSLYHLKQQKKCKVLGMDVSRKALSIQKKYGVKTALITKKNIKSLKNVDYVILAEVLEHLTNPEETILSLKSHTKNFVLSVPNSAYFAYRLQLLFRGRISMQWMYHPSEHLRYWSHVEFIEWCESLGLVLRKYKCSEGILTSIDFLPNLLSWNIVYLFEVT